jgi:PAS domain S-box-containing protein
MKRTKHITGFEKTETERKQAEKALKETTNLLQSIMNSSTEVIIVATDPTGNILTWNEGATMILGYKPEEIIGKKNIRIFYTEEDIKSGAIEKAIKNMESTRKPLLAELNYVTKDGKNFLVQQILTPRFNENGKFIGIIGMSTNINEYKKVERVLKNYQFMVETANDAIFYKDLESRYIIANLKTLETFGLSREQVIGKNDYELMPDQKEARKNIEDDQIVFKSKNPTEIIKRMTNRDNKEYWFQAVKVPQFDAQGNVIGLVGIAIDITERKQA